LAKQPTIASPGADDRHGNGRHRASDLLLVLGVGTVVLGLVLVSCGVLSPQYAAPRVPRTYPVPGVVERLVPAPRALPSTTRSPADRVPATPETQTVGSGPSPGVATCFPHGVVMCPARLDLDHDWRLVLSAMALQRRRTMHPIAHVVPPDMLEVPAKDRALARAMESVSPGEASPPAVGLPRGPGC
jgi:hypothetical protein